MGLQALEADLQGARKLPATPPTLGKDLLNRHRAFAQREGEPILRAVPFDLKLDQEVEVLLGTYLLLSLKHAHHVRQARHGHHAHHGRQANHGHHY